MKVRNNTSSNDLYRWIFDYAEFGIIMTDHAMTITDANRWIQDHSEREKPDLLGKSLFEAFPEITERKLENYLHNALNGASSILSARFHEYLLRFNYIVNNQAIAMKQNVRITPLLEDDPDSSGIKGLVIYIEDVTERLRREEQMQIQNEELRELNSTKDNFLRIISHDLRSPFTAMMGFTEILINDDSLPEENRRAIIRMLHTSIKDNYSFLENLLKWSQLHTGHFELDFTCLNLNQIIDHVLSIAQPVIRSKEINVDVSGIHPQITICTDKQALTSIIYNLFFNALKFTPSQGRVEIITKIDSGSLIISVRDNGIGIKEEKLKKLFRIEEKITSTPGTNKEKGSGMGLLLVKELVDRLDGKIWAESIPGAGSTFHIMLKDSIISMPVGIPNNKD